MLTRTCYFQFESCCKLSKSVNQKLKFLFRVSPYIDQSNKEALFNSFIKARFLLQCITKIVYKKDN